MRHSHILVTHDYHTHTTHSHSLPYSSPVRTGPVRERHCGPTNLNAVKRIHRDPDAATSRSAISTRYAPPMIGPHIESDSLRFPGKCEQRPNHQSRRAIPSSDQVGSFLLSYCPPSDASTSIRQTSNQGRSDNLGRKASMKKQRPPIRTWGSRKQTFFFYLLERG